MIWIDISETRQNSYDIVLSWRWTLYRWVLCCGANSRQNMCVVRYGVRYVISVRIDNDHVGVKVDYKKIEVNRGKLVTTVVRQNSSLDECSVIQMVLCGHNKDVSGLL